MIEECVLTQEIKNDYKLNLQNAKLRNLLVAQHQVNLKNMLSREEYNELIRMINLEDFCGCFIDEVHSRFFYNEMLSPTFPSAKDVIIIQNIEENCLLKHMK